MIPCQICGKDASLGWVKGYVPAPDSQKLALCPKHDSPENRKKLLGFWHGFMLDAIHNATQVAAYQAARGQLRLLTLQFTAGGSLSMPCVNVAPTEHGTLKVTGPDGRLSFFPMQHLRRYDLSPLALETANAPPRADIP